MSFNTGFLCPNCGPVPEAKDRSIRKVKHKCCKKCEAIVSPWQRPMNERAGRCGNCAYAAFTLAIVKGRLVRCCKRCLEVMDADTQKILRKGKEEFKWQDKKQNTMN